MAIAEKVKRETLLKLIKPKQTVKREREREHASVALLLIALIILVNIVVMP